MAATPLAERPLSLKVLGAGLIALMLFFMWLTYAFFTKAFVDVEEVTVETGKAGLNLPQNADVKLRGMIVGEVREIEPSDEGVRLVLGIKPDMIDDVPADVSAQLVPKTLFGEKYVALIPGEGASSDDALQAGDVIERAEVPIEVEKLLNDFYPLLQAVEPADLSYTLTAVADALEGRGEELGETLVSANEYLTALNPDVPQFVDNLVAFGEVADGYSEALPELGRLLTNSTTTGNTVVEKQAELGAFFAESTRLSDTLTAFVDANADSLDALAAQNRVLLGVSSRYATTFPCFLGGMATVLPRLDSVLRNGTVHIDLEFLSEQPTPYDEDENAKLPSDAQIEATPQADPDNFDFVETTGERGVRPDGLGAVCEDLAQYKAGKMPNSQDDPFNVAPEVYTLVGIDNTHNGKFGDDESIYERAAASLDAVDTPSQRADLKALAAGIAGVDADEVPDVASILLSPIVRGSEVTVR